MNNLLQSFREKYGESSEEPRIFFAPGRVNLIGEHIDYNGGNVFPCAVELGTYLVVRKRSDEQLRFFSMNFPDKGIIELNSRDVQYKEEQYWVNYPAGVISALKEKTGHFGMDLLYYGNLPNGAGLSSSASIELVTALMLNEVYRLELPQLELVKLSQRVENEFIGVNCGIMDQFAVGFGKKNHGILLDCETLDYTYLPLNMESESIVIANTNKRRGLADSAYNERRATCESALVKLREKLELRALADMTMTQFEEYQTLLNEEEQKRVKHVVSENARTLKAAEVLKAGDLDLFGQLMNASHRSLQHDYEVSCKELDTLVEAAWKHKGTLGARMTGAGFGGCTVNIVKDSEVDSFIEETGRKYREEIGYEASFYVAKAGDGVRELQKEEWESLTF